MTISIPWARHPEISSSSQSPARGRHDRQPPGHRQVDPIDLWAHRGSYGFAAIIIPEERLECGMPFFASVDAEDELVGKALLIGPSHVDDGAMYGGCG